MYGGMLTRKQGSESSLHPTPFALVVVVSMVTLHHWLCTDHISDGSRSPWLLLLSCSVHNMATIVHLTRD